MLSDSEFEKAKIIERVRKETLAKENNGMLLKNILKMPFLNALKNIRDHVF